MRRVLKLVGLGLLVLLLAGLAILAITGLPSPPAITADGVPRVPWKLAWQMVSGVKDMQAVTRFANWVPGREEILVGAGMARTVHRVGAPGAAPEPIEGLPAFAYNLVFPTDPDPPSFVFALDEGGSELYRLYRHDWASASAVPLTETRAFLESISPLSHAERITVPLMIYQGANDVRIKPQESRQMVERIRSTGGTVHYIEAADEGHDLSRPLNLLYVGAAYGDLLNECLFGGTT